MGCTCICNEAKVHRNLVCLHVSIDVVGVYLLHVVNALNVDPHVGAKDVDPGEVWVALAVMARIWEGGGIGRYLEARMEEKFSHYTCTVVQGKYRLTIQIS